MINMQFCLKFRVIIGISLEKEKLDSEIIRTGKVPRSLGQMLSGPGHESALDKQRLRLSD